MQEPSSVQIHDELRTKSLDMIFESFYRKHFNCVFFSHLNSFFGKKNLTLTVFLPREKCRNLCCNLWSTRWEFIIERMHWFSAFMRQTYDIRMYTTDITSNAPLHTLLRHHHRLSSFHFFFYPDTWVHENGNKIGGNPNEANIYVFDNSDIVFFKWINSFRTLCSFDVSQHCPTNDATDASITRLKWQAAPSCAYSVASQNQLPLQQSRSQNANGTKTTKLICSFVRMLRSL